MKPTLSALLAHELSAIAAIEAAKKREKDPERILFLHAAKEGHQTAAGQLEWLIALGGGRARKKPPLVSKAMKLQMNVTQLTRKKWTLASMRAVEVALLEAYRALRARSTGLAARALDVCIARGNLRATILAAHLEDRDALPKPLSSYRRTAHTCMRCLLDRSPQLADVGSLTRDEPKIYVCAACHEEVLGELPPDLRSALETASPEVQRDRILEHALGKPSKENAKKTVYGSLVARTAKERALFPKPVARVKTILPRTSHATAKTKLPMLILDPATTEAEDAYTARLLDPASLARWW